MHGTVSDEGRGTGSSSRVGGSGGYYFCDDNTGGAELAGVAPHRLGDSTRSIRGTSSNDGQQQIR